MIGNIEHEIQKAVLDRLNIEWTPGEPFVNVVEYEIQRLRWLIEWVNEHASFTKDEWPVWEKLQEAKEPWLSEDADL